MTKLFAGTPHAKFIAAASAVILTIAIATSARGVQLQAARVTQVVNDVKLRGKEAPRPVALGDLIRHGDPVSTGTQSRSELTFADGTTTRLGANTSFSFKPGTREMNLIDGAILFQVPKGSGGATIKTAGVTAAITGTTGIAEFHPATASHPHLFSKWLCLEGTFRLYLPNGQSVEVGPGKMVTTDGESFSPVLTFDIARLVSTSLFFTGFDRPLPSLDLIVLEEQKQLFAPPTPNPLDPARIVNVTSQAIVAEEAQTSPSESPTPPITPTPPVTPTPPPPTPSEFGTPSVITSPVPYVITDSTVITTDPSITTNGMSDFGKIYRGPVDDGAFSLWAFGSTSAVDTALDFDTNFENAGHFPLAAFKFTSLVLAGNPTIDLSNGVTNLALISVGDITSGLPGGTLTFSGLDAVLLASQDGSINLGSEIAFQGIPTLFFYARGTNGDLTLASPIIGTTDLFLYAGRNITFNAGTDLILGGQFSTRSAGGNISVSESGNIAIGGSFAATSDVIADAANGGNITFATEGSFSASDVVVETTVEPGVTLTDGANISFDIGTSLTVNGGSLSLTINDSNGGTIGTGGNITLNTGANLTVNGGAALTLDVLNNDGGHIGTGGNISVTTGGDLTAGSVDALINNSGGTIGGSANLAFNLNGQLATQSDTSFTINNSNGGTIGADAAINVTANNISTGGVFNALIDNTSAGTIGGSANLSVNLSGDLAAQGDALFKIDNSNGNMIGADAGLNVRAASISAGGFLLAQIFNYAGGSIVGSANIVFNLAGDLTAQNTAVLVISNFNGGTIGSDAAVTLSANNISSGVEVDAEIANYLVGNIGGNATINVTAANISTDAFDAEISNYLGGNIGGNATVNVTAANITANSLVADVNNSNGGSIGSGATVTLNVGGNLGTQNDAAFQILNFDNGSGSGPGTIGSNATANVTANNVSIGGALSANIINFGGGAIGGNATINVTAANITTGAALTAAIDNSTEGNIGGIANLSFNLTGDLTTGGDASFTIDNSNVGTIGVDAGMSLSAASISTVGSLFANILNFASGNIVGGADLSLNLTGDLTTQGDALLTISNDVGGTIGSDAVINVTAANISTGGALNAAVVNSSGGSGGNIVGSANINYNLTGDLITQGNAFLTILNDPGTIGSHAMINVTANNVSTGTLNAAIDNSSGGMIGGMALLFFDLSGGLASTSSDASFRIDNANRNGISGGSINGDAIIDIGLGGDISAQGTGLFAISNDDAGSGNGGGTIGGSAIINVGAANISTGGLLSATIDNFGGGTIGGNATINVTAASITANSLLAQIDNSNGGSIGFLSGSSANVTLNVGGDLTTTQGDATFQVLNSDNGSGPGTIGSDAVINVAANNISTGGALVADIFNLTGGTIGGNATVNVTAKNISAGGGRFSASILNGGGNIGLDAAVNVSAASISASNVLVTNILNFGGTIGGNATIIDLTAANINTFALQVAIDNSNGGSIGSGANITLNVGGDITNQSGSGAEGFINNAGGTIGGNATFNMTAANITAPSLLAHIDNSNGGSIGGNAAINMNVSGSATIANDATFQILGSDGAAAAAINFNNGSYDVGGTFLSSIDGNGTITFNNASAHADVLKAGVFGTNGVLNVGGGSLSADTTLKLYAPGSNGQLNFVSNVTLGGNSAKILAANSVTIFNNIVVTIGGPNPADVFVNFVGGVPNANYTGFGGNNSTTGTFAGAGANNPQPLINAPPFGPASPVKLTAGGNIPIATAVPPQSAPGRTPVPGGNITSRTRIAPPSRGENIADMRRASNVINVRSSDELLSLLDDAAPGPSGKITIPASKITNNSRHSSRVDPAGRLNPVSRSNVDRRAMDLRTASSSLMRRSPQ